ncbi:MAG: MoaD/ThiS family protein [Sedimentibacter sp.]|uniref:MoaD/ThiS family protein n=1 Tax=Sedimentibacter sp. TaxID=1960295 RepID=UPI0031581C59
MIVEISKVFLYDISLKSIINLEIKDGSTIREVVDLLSVKNTDYAMFFVNGKVAQNDDVVNNSDKLSILPVFDGG